MLFGGTKREGKSLVIGVLKFGLFIKSCHLCTEVLAGLLFVSDILCHFEGGLGGGVFVF